MSSLGRASKRPENDTAVAFAKGERLRRGVKEGEVYDRTLNRKSVQLRFREGSTYIQEESRN